MLESKYITELIIVHSLNKKKYRNKRRYFTNNREINVKCIITRVQTIPVLHLSTEWLSYLGHTGNRTALPTRVGNPCLVPEYFGATWRNLPTFRQYKDQLAPKSKLPKYELFKLKRSILINLINIRCINNISRCLYYI